MRYGLCEKFLIQFFEELRKQTFKDFDIIVADQSDTNELKDICKKYSTLFDIKHIRNTKGLNSVADNVNLAISNATGEIIKILFVDDFFIEDTALQDTWDAFQDNPDKKWLIAGFVNCNEEKTNYFNKVFVNFNNPIPNGDNWAGNPSSYSVRKECLLYMDEKLRYIVDSELFERSYLYYGPPIIIEKLIHCLRVHRDSLYINKDFHYLESVEKKYVEEKFKKLIEEQQIKV
jgi:glycosyltransferase involved in cell wall biosynthesis